jgi:hypothetical protein
MEQAVNLRVQMGYHELDSPPWVITYWVFILGYSQIFLNKRLLKNLEKS